MDNRVCDSCKRGPEVFTTPEQKFAFWVVVPRETMEPNILMSDLSEQFRICLDINPVQKTDELFYCVNCIASIIEGDESEDE